MLDRLIEIYLPDLNAHFGQEQISAQLFASPWFITLFTNSQTHKKGIELSNNLLVFWDIFLTDGIVTVYKVALILLAYFEDRLMHMPFEQSL